MSRWVLVRALLVALSFLSVTVALATVPGRAIGYWYLYFSPVTIAALSFGLLGAVVASGGAIFSVFAFFLQFDQIAQKTGLALAQRLGGPESTLLREVEDALSQVVSSTSGVMVGGAPLGAEATQAVLYQAVFGVVLITVLSCIVGWLVDENRRHAASYRLQALTDSLTGLANYRRLMDSLTDEISRSRRFNHQFAFLMVDVDTLKQCNDAYGHIVGDAILTEVGKLLRGQLREIDTVARYGGDEFGILLVETGELGAAAAAERLRQAIEGHAISVGNIEVKVTISIGVGVYPLNGQDLTQLVEAADAALYEAKRGGKNAVAFATV